MKNQFLLLPQLWYFPSNCTINSLKNWNMQILPGSSTFHNKLEFSISWYRRYIDMSLFVWRVSHVVLYGHSRVIAWRSWRCIQKFNCFSLLIYWLRPIQVVVITGKVFPPLSSDLHRPIVLPTASCRIVTDVQNVYYWISFRFRMFSPQVWSITYCVLQ